jgi:hypothetical protein
MSAPLETLTLTPLVYALDHATDSLDAGSPPLAPVAWVSAHVAASARTVRMEGYRRGARQSADAAAASGRRLLTAARVFERAHAGDGQVAGIDDVAVHAALRRAIDTHRQDELALAADLLARPDSPALATLVAAYERALPFAPTRPHPRTRARGPIGRGVVRAETIVDRVLDAMDGRPAPIPRQRAARGPAGRWGRYLLGG